MPKPMYVWSGTAWVSVASEVESLATYATQSYADNATGLRMVIPTSVTVGSGSASVSATGAVTFSGASTVDIDGAFTSTYKHYKVIIENISATTSTDDLQLQWRYGTTTQATFYYGSSIQYAATSTITQTANTTQLTLAANTGSSSQPGNFDITMMNMGVSGVPYLVGSGYELQNSFVYNFGGSCNATQVWSGFRLKSSSTNISGTLRIYGYKN